MILFDETEKAHPEVFNLLLQILDDGRLTDGQGRTVNFKNTIIIMTSNIGSQYLTEKDSEKVRELIQDELRRTFRPDFLNRIDEVIIFNRLTEENLEQIVEIQVKYLQKRLAEKEIELALTEKVKKYLAQEGYDVVYGARPVKRTIQKLVENPLAEKIIAGEIKEGNKVKIDYSNSAKAIVFSH